MIAKPQKKESRLSSLSLSFLLPKGNIKYFNCIRDNELLNYVCTKKTCDKKGLICSICKVDHKNHEIIPLKILLGELEKQKKKKQKCQDGFQQQLQELENIYKRMLFQLKNCVEKLADKFKEIQIQIHEEFNQAKLQLLQRVQVSMKLPNLIQEALHGKLQNRQQFIKDIQVIVQMITIKQKKGNIKQQNIKYAQNYKQIIKNYEKVQKSLSENINMILKYVLDKKLGKYCGYKLGEHQQIDNQCKVNKDIINTMHFQQNIKSKSIILTCKNKIATQQTGDGRFVFTNVPVWCKQYKKVVFKIKTLKNWIGLGVAIRQKIKNLQYKFQYDKIGHGSYMISSNGFTWSHTEIHNNIKNVAFNFSQGDILEVQLKKNKLMFMNKTLGKKYQLNISLTEDILKDVYFCANLCSEGDSVEIVEQNSHL